jgi:trimeric autotransporter adhesin
VNTNRLGLIVTALALISLSLSGCDDDSDGNAQQRVTGTCAVGSFITSINADGTVNCNAAGAGDITDVTAGGGLTGGGTSGSVALSVNTAAVQSRVTGVCGAGTFAVSINADGTTVCAPGGDITSVVAGAGLVGGSNSGDVALSIAAGGVDASHLADGAVTMAKASLPAGSGTAMMNNGFSTVFPATLAVTEPSGQCMVSVSANTLGLASLPGFEVRPVAINQANLQFTTPEWGYSYEIFSSAGAGTTGREANATAVLNITGAGPWRFGCQIEGNQTNMRCRVSYLCT